MNTPKKQLDSVASYLASVPGHSPSAIGWLDGQRELGEMRRRAVFCVFAAWLMLTVAAIVAAVTALMMSANVRSIFDEQFRDDLGSILAIVYVPWILFSIAAVLLVGGLVALLSGYFPGLRSTRSALDWSSAADAVSRLLSAGCTYPDAFRVAAAAMPSSESRGWLIHAAERVEKGMSPTLENNVARGDTAVLELMLGAVNDQPQHQWSLATEHFFVVAKRRLMLLTHTVPMITTVLAGFLIWVSISTTLGWMWKSVGSMVNGFGF
ncbi:hypothetical protein [Rubripirellula tenax]|nr:hypothetical protein [Rubripirellula tenax]